MTDIHKLLPGMLLGTRDTEKDKAVPSSGCVLCRRAPAGIAWGGHSHGQAQAGVSTVCGFFLFLMYPGLQPVRILLFVPQPVAFVPSIPLLPGTPGLQIWADWALPVSQRAPGPRP